MAKTKRLLDLCGLWLAGQNEDRFFRKLIDAGVGWWKVEVVVVVGVGEMQGVRASQDAGQSEVPWDEHRAEGGAQDDGEEERFEVSLRDTSTLSREGGAKDNAPGEMDRTVELQVEDGQETVQAETVEVCIDYAQMGRDYTYCEPDAKAEPVMFSQRTPSDPSDPRKQGSPSEPRPPPPGSEPPVRMSMTPCKSSSSPDGAGTMSKSQRQSYGGESMIYAPISLEGADADEKLFVRVVRADGLRAADLLGTSDPFARATVERSGELLVTMETSVRWKTTSPVWEEEFELGEEDMERGSAMRLEVWDRDRLGKDDFLGEVVIDMASIAGNDIVRGGEEMVIEKALEANRAKSSAAPKGTITVGFRFSDGVSQGVLWVPPSRNRAAAHKARKRPWNRETHKPVSFWSREFSDGALGDGIALWIRFLWQSSLLFLLLFLVNLAPLLVYVTGDGIPQESRRGQGILAVPSIGNLYTSARLAQIKQAHSSVLGNVTMSLFGTNTEVPLSMLSWGVPALDIIGTWILLMFVLWLRRSQQQLTSSLNTSQLQVQDYAVSLHGLTRGRASAEGVKQYLEEKYGRVACVHIVAYSEAFLTSHERAAAMSHTVETLRGSAHRAQQKATEKGKRHPVYYVQDPVKSWPTLTTRKASYLGLVRRLEAAEKKLEKIEADKVQRGQHAAAAGGSDAVVAFAVFEESSSRDACLLDSAGWGVWCRSLSCCTAREKRGEPASARVEEAPDPANLLWHNLSYSRSSRNMRACVVISVALLLLVGSFAAVLQAQLYQRRNPLDTCPPMILDSPVDSASRAYFSNKDPRARGPGAVGVGLSRLLDMGSQATFGVHGVCRGGGGELCSMDSECPDGSGGCEVFDLGCSYRKGLEGVDVGSKSERDKGILLDTSFLANSTMDWQGLGLPGFCDETRFVVEASTASKSLSMQTKPANYTPSAALNGTRACEAALPGATPQQCKRPVDQCSSYPGCVVDAGGLPECVESRQVTGCVETISWQPVDANGTAAGARLSASTPISQADYARCAAAPAGCLRSLDVQYSDTVTAYASVPVYFEAACQRYKNSCSACFCVDTIGDFFVVWLFNLSESYSGVCSGQFSTLMRRYALFGVAAASVILVNMALRYLLSAFSSFEKKFTISRQERSIAGKVMFAQLINTAFVPLLVYARVRAAADTQCRDGPEGTAWDPERPTTTFGQNGMPCLTTDMAEGEPVCSWGKATCRAVVPESFPILAGVYEDFSSQWYGDVGAQIMITVMINIAVTCLPFTFEYPFQIIYEFFARHFSHTQAALEKAYEGPEFELASRYGALLSAIMVCLFYSSGAPAFYLLASLTCLFAYLTDKFCLHYLYRTPPRYDHQLAVFASNVLPVGAVMHMLVGAWQYTAILPSFPIQGTVADLAASLLDDQCRSNPGDDCVWQCWDGTTPGPLCDPAGPPSCPGSGTCRGSSQDALRFSIVPRLLNWTAMPLVALSGLLFLFFLGRVIYKSLRNTCRSVTSVQGGATHPPYSKAMLSSDDFVDEKDQNKDQAKQGKWVGPVSYDIRNISKYRALLQNTVEEDGLSWVAPYVRHVLEEAALAHPPSTSCSPALPNGVTRHVRKDLFKQQQQQPAEPVEEDPVEAGGEEVCGPAPEAAAIPPPAHILSPQRAEVRGDSVQCKQLPSPLMSPDDNIASPPPPPAQMSGETPTPPGAEGGAGEVGPEHVQEAHDLFPQGGAGVESRPATGGSQGRRRRRGPLAALSRASGDQQQGGQAPDSVAPSVQSSDAGHGFEEPALGIA